MVNVCFAGITGWAASAIVAAIDDADDLTLTSGVSRSAAGQNLATATGSASHGSVYATVAEALESAAVEVLVDYTSAAAVKSNVWTAVEAGVHVVIGSSGLTSDDYEELDRLARDRGVGVIAAGNFSVMAAVLRRAASMAAEHVDRWEIIDPDLRPSQWGAATHPSAVPIGRYGLPRSSGLDGRRGMDTGAPCAQPTPSPGRSL